MVEGEHKKAFMLTKLQYSTTTAGSDMHTCIWAHIEAEYRGTLRIKKSFSIPTGKILDFHMFGLFNSIQ